MDSGPRSVFNMVFFALALMLSVFVIKNSLAANSQFRGAVADYKAGAKAKYAVQSVLETVSFGWFQGASESDRRTRNLVESAQSHDSWATFWGWLLVLLSALYVASAAIPQREPDHEISIRVVRHLMGVCLFFFIIGVMCPILSLVVFKNVPVFGFTILKFESKGVLSSIATMFSSGNQFIAAIIGITSVLIPTAKIVGLYGASWVPDHVTQHRIAKFIELIGKWSMVDVFVVAVLLVLFAVNGDESSDAEFGHGLYFFAGYCLLSMLAAWMFVVHSSSEPKDQRG